MIHKPAASAQTCIVNEPGDVAQLVAHRLCKAGVVGSSPIVSTEQELDAASDRPLRSDPQSSFVATAFGVTFIFGTYSASSITRPIETYCSRSTVRQSSHGP